jgi:hypothetical protein
MLKTAGQKDTRDSRQTWSGFNDANLYVVEGPAERQTERHGWGLMILIYIQKTVGQKDRQRGMVGFL